MSTASARRLVTALLLTLATASVHAQAYRNPLVNSATVAAPADISDPTPGNNSSSDTNTLAATAQLSVLKTITTPVPVAAGGAVQYRIEVRNTGPSQAAGATLSDPVPAQLTGVTWTCAPVSAATSCAAASGTGSLNVGVNVGVGDVLVVLVNGTAPTVTPATIAANAATITPPPGTTDPTPGDNTGTTPTIPVQAAAIVANNDDFSATPLAPGAGGTTARVFDNDTLGGAAFADAAVVATLTVAPAGYAINANGTVSVPATAAAGAVALTYQICEAASPSNCASANVSLVVAPNAVDDSYSVQAGQTVTGNVRDNDNYVVDSTFTQTGVGPTQGTLQLLGDGNFTYTANAGATGTDTFSYQLCLVAPNGGVCDTATVTVNLTANVIDAVNDDFSATPVPAAAGGITASVLGNDTFNGAPVVPANLTTTLITAPAGYTVSAAGQISVPANAVAGPVGLAYRICVTAAPTLCDTATVQVVVAPDAVDDAVTTPGAGQPVSANVGSNDNTPAGSLFTAAGAVPTKGSVTVNSDGSFTYTPIAGASGTDTFGYQVCLPIPAGVCDTAIVTVTLGANALMANDDLYPTPVSALTGGSTPSVLGNDTLNGVVVTPGTVTATLQGGVAGFTLDATTGVITVAAGVPAGATALSYQLCENAVPTNCSTANVQVLVSPPAQPDSFNVQSGQSVNGNVGSNDAPPAGATFAALTQPTAGSLVFNDDGTFTYTSPAGSTGSDSFNYQVCLPAPNSGVCAATTATLVIAANTLDAVDDPFTAPAISPVTGGSTPSVLGNDLYNGAPATAAQVTLSLVNAPPPGYTITSAGVINVPAGAAAGAVSLTYELCEAGTASNCDTAQVALLIAPAAGDDTYSTPAGQPLLGDVSLNDNAPAGSIYSVLTPPAAGSLVLQANGTFTYTPVGAGAQTAQYQVCLPAPDAGTCATGTVSITVIANTLDAQDDNFRTPAFAPGVGGNTPSVLGNDTFNGAAANPLQVTVNLAGAPAGFSMDAAGVITVASFAPAGATTLGYTLCELGSTTNCDTAAVQVLIAPDAQDDSVSVTGTQPGSFNLAANDNVPSGATFTVTVAPTKGSAVLANDGTLQYTATAGQSGADALTYQVCLPAPDGATCDSAQVAISIAAAALVAVNDDYSASPVPPSGGSTPSVLLNDTFNGVAIVPGTTPVTASLTTLVSGYSMATNGVITVAAGTPPGSVALNYQVCETASPGNCAAAIAVVVMSPDAVNDVLPATAGGTTVLNVLANDLAPPAPGVTVTVAPTGGTAVANADGTVSYTPTGSFVGPDTFTYQLCLPAPHGSVCDTATVALTVTAATVTAANDNFTGTPIAPAAGGTTASVLLNDTFNGSPIVPGTTPVTATLLNAVPGYTLAPDGVVTIAAGTTPAAVTLSYQVCETALPSNCAAATAVVAVSPDATDDALPATAGTSTILNVLGNDTAPQNPVLSIVAPPANGQAVANGDGSVSYTPNAGYVGADTFTYRLCLPAPGAGVCDTASVAVTVSATTLTASNDDFTATPIAPAAGGSTASVLLNDSFNGAAIVPGSTPVTAALSSPVPGYTMAANGVISVAAGTAPAAVTLNYQVCENALPTNCAGATAVVAVRPDAVDDALPATAGTTTVLNVLANDTAPLNPTVSVPVAPANGTALVNGDGTVSYTPNAGFTGPDTFTYQVCLPAPGAAVCDTATLTITVTVTTLTAVADDFRAAPIAPAGGGNTASVLLNDTFNGAVIVPGTTPVAASLVTPVAGYSMAADGVVTVAAGTTPAAITLSYQVCEVAVPTNCAQTTAVVAVRPDAADDTLPAGTGTTVLSVATNDTLPANPVFTVLVPPTNGTAVVNGDNTISYTPTAGFTGSDSFTYQVCLPAPNLNVCDTATVGVTVTASSLDAVDDNFSGSPTLPGGGGTTPSVLANDTLNGVSVQPAQVVVILVAPPAGISIDGNGIISIAGSAAAGAVQLQYQICETASAANCDTATALVLIRPDAINDTATTPSGQSVSGSLAGNDNAPPSAAYSLVTAPVQGTVVLNADGSYIYTPVSGYTGTDAFIYQVCLPSPYAGACDTATLTITVGAASTPDAVDDTLTNVPATGALGVVNVFANDTFNGAALDPSTVLLTANNTTALTIQPNGSLDVAAGTPGATYTTTYRICLVAQPAVCDIGTVSVTLASTPGLLDAVDDTVANVPVAGATGAANVLTNDTYNSVALDPATVVLTPVNTAAITIQPNGSVDVAGGTPGTTYTTTYQICLVAQPAVCDVGTVSVTLAAAGVVVATDDNVPDAPPGGGSGLGNVLDNDTLNGAPVDPTSVILTPVNTPALTIQPDGSVTVAPGTPGTTYTTTYQICLVAQPTVCDTGTLSVTLAAAPSAVPEASDDQATTPQDVAVDVPVLANDVSNGTPVDPGTVVVAISTAPTMGTAVVLPDSRLRYTPMTNFSGMDSFTYSVCSTVTPQNCSSATVSVQTGLNDVDVVDENITVLSGTTTNVPLLDNLTTSGARINPASMRLGRAASSGRATCANGDCVYTAFVGYSGLDNFSYTICDRSLPTPVCVEGWVHVVVTADTVVLRLTKQATQRSVRVGDVVRYVVTVENMGDVDALGATLYDTLPSGFTFIPGGFEVRDADNAARASGVAPLRIDGVDIPAGGTATLVYYLRVGAGVGMGIHTNRITANDVLGTTISNVASADVEVIGDPLLDESLVIGSVFDDRNGNGAQDPGERGIPGVRVVSVEGLVIETDAWGRYHLVGINGGQARGRNFILKVDPTTLPAEARFTTRNPLVRRITPGLPVRFDFGVAMPEGRLGEGPPQGPQKVLEVGEALFVPGQATFGAAAEAVLAHAAGTLQTQGGGRVDVARGQATPALAAQRAGALRNALLPRLPAEVAAHVQVQVQPAAPDRPATRADR
jgi:uncharacterized repeat protein (TIGR01451 family)